MPTLKETDREAAGVARPGGRARAIRSNWQQKSAANSTAIPNAKDANTLAVAQRKSTAEPRPQCLLKNPGHTLQAECAKVLYGQPACRLS